MRSFSRSSVSAVLVATLLLRLHLERPPHTQYPPRPWIFIVDGNGTLRAKYQGVLGTEDVDVIVALIAQGG